MGKSSERPVAGAVLRFDQSGDLLRKVLENAAVGTVVIGHDRRLLYVNTAFSDMLGYPADATIGRDVAEFIHADDDAATTQHLKRLISGETEEHRGECRLVHQDGDAVWALASASVLRSEVTGRPLYIIWQVVNVDRQKRAEAALAYSESRWSFALEAARQGVWDHDIRRDDMFYSKTWRTMRGYAPDEYVDPAQSEWLKRVHPDDVPRITAVVHKQDRGEEGFDTLEYRERHKDGHYIWILSRGRPVEWDADGNHVRTIGTDTDITRLKSVEAQLEAEKARLRVTLESIGDGVISTDAKGKVDFLNPVAEHMTGWLSEAAVGQPVESVFNIVTEVDGAAVKSPVRTCLARGETAYLDEDVQLLSPEGERCDVRCSAAPLRGQDGKLLGSVLVFQDITNSRTLQKQLAHSATHDGLTGLPNRVAFERALITVADQSRQEMRQHALCFVDLDRFKAVNDAAGHAAGDALLRQVGSIIRHCCRRQDFAARIGGDEFAILLSDCPMQAARRVAQKIVDAVEAIRFEWDGNCYSLGASIGITGISSHSPAPQELMSQADAACYAAKAGGRGRVAIYQGEDGKVA